ncbi:ArsR/SmtB family transcription factor [Streptomyces purpurascens]|uniref:ArsR/SmtB family transcription factor n=1 Tax=Streptomyces purpurascens TaxID=1924 RepID=UPI003863ECA8
MGTGTGTGNRSREPEPGTRAGGPALAALLGAPRTALPRLPAEPLPTVEPARRLRVPTGAVSRHLRVLHATGLVTRARDGRRVLHRRSPLGERLARQGAV